MGFLGLDPSGTSRSYVLDLPAGAPRPVSPAGGTRALISPDGATMAVVDSLGRLTLFPVGPGAPRGVAGLLPGEIPVGWEASSRALFVYDQTVPVRVFRLELDTGQRRQVLDLEPPDPAGVLYATVVLTPDARHYVVRYRRVRNDLHLVTGLR
jgi:hypothetical protein